MTLEQLRLDAELNLCEKCYGVYLSFIEPNIRELIVKRLDDWRSTESDITQMVMKHRGVFKTDVWIIFIGEWDDKYHEDVDKDLFYKTKKWPVWKKIKYLKNNELLPEACYRLLDKARERRNMIHEDPLVYRFTDKDLDLFSQAHNVSAILLQVMRTNLPEDIQERMIKNCETASKRYLEKNRTL